MGIVLSYISLFYMNNPVLVFAEQDQRSQAISQIYSNYLWPFIYFILASLMWLGIAGFVVGILKASWNANNPQGRAAAYRTLFREFVFLSATGSFGLIYSIVVSLMSAAQ